MWAMTSTGGFFSAVEHRQDNSLLMVRCRAEADADYIAKKTDTTVIRSNGKADYEFRVVVSKARFAAFIMTEIMDIDYDNFKNSVKKRQGSARANVYMSVWSALCKLQPVRPYENVTYSWPKLGKSSKSKTPTAGSQALYPVGPRGGVQQHWWDNDSLVGGYERTTPLFSDEDEGARARLEDDETESVTDDPEFWNCRVCNRDFTDCDCFRDSARQTQEADSARKKTRNRKRSKRGGGHAKNR